MPVTNLRSLKLTPAQIDILNTLVPTDDLDNLANCLIVGGEDLRVQTAAPWRRRKVGLINEYGPTEATVGATIYELNQTDR